MSFTVTKSQSNGYNYRFLSIIWGMQKSFIKLICHLSALGHQHAVSLGLTLLLPTLAFWPLGKAREAEYGYQTCLGLLPTFKVSKKKISINSSEHLFPLKKLFSAGLAFSTTSQAATCFVKN